MIIIIISIALLIIISFWIVFIIMFKKLYTKYSAEKTKNDKLNNKIELLKEEKDRLNEDVVWLTAEKNKLTNQIQANDITKEWKENNQKQIEEINSLLKEKIAELKNLENLIEKTKTEVKTEEKNKEELSCLIEKLNYDLSQKQAAWNSVNNFEKNGFGNELPYIDYEEFFKQNKFETVLKLLDNCIEVAPQFLSELRKIEWNLCYLPYKKTFIKEFSRSGIYMLEVKPQYEEEVLKELGLKRINDSGSIVYIGQAVNVYDRWTTHIKKMLGIESSGNEKIYKFKPLVFKWKVIEWCDSSVLNEREKFWIDSFKSDEFGLNSKGGNKKE